MELKELKQKIQDLINKAVKTNDNQKQTLSFLFDRLAEIKELETIDRLRRFQGGSEYLRAYLLYKQIARSNYQLELIKHANFEDDEEKGGQDKLLEAIARDIEAFEDRKKKQTEAPIEQPSNEKLLIMLGERIEKGEIKKQVCDYDDGYISLYIGRQSDKEDNNLLKDYDLRVWLDSGKVEPDQVVEFLIKHEIKKK